MNHSKTHIPFQFHADKTVDENIASFLDLLDARDPELTDMLRKHLGIMLPLPLEAPARSAARMKFSSAIIKAVDALKK